jgi:hypothetical protein
VGSIPFSRSDSISDPLWGFGDLLPMMSLRWNAGVNNYMVYATGDVPVGAYDPSRLSNALTATARGLGLWTEPRPLRLGPCWIEAFTEGVRVLAAALKVAPRRAPFRWQPQPPFGHRPELR